MTRFTRSNKGVGSTMAGLALAALIASPALAGGDVMMEPETGRKLELSANVALSTEYVFRGISQTDENAAISGGFDATYGSFYIGLWASNLDFGSAPDDCGLLGQTGDCADIEIDWYLGFAPSLRGINFDIGVIYYTYPNALDPGAELDYWEVKAGVGGKIADPLKIGFAVYYSPEYSGEIGENWVFEFAAEASLPKLMGRIDPTISAAVGYQEGEEDEGGSDYTYWNAGVAFGFHGKFSIDVRYWDTDISGCGTATLFQCDERVVGTLSASF